MVSSDFDGLGFLFGLLLRVRGRRYQMTSSRDSHELLGLFWQPVRSVESEVGQQARPAPSDPNRRDCRK